MGNDYVDKLKDPRWQKKRLQILERDEWCCQKCFDNESTLVVHHRLYLPGGDPWDCPNEYLVTLCEECHTEETEGREKAERELLEALRWRFFVDDVKTLTKGFRAFTVPEVPYLAASVIEHVLSSPGIYIELREGFLRSLALKGKVLASPNVSEAEHGVG